jgi:hypothetical protein
MFSILSITHFFTSSVCSFGNFILACAADLVVFSKIFEFVNYRVKGQSVLAETLEKGCKGLLRNDVIQERIRFTKADLYRAWHFEPSLR